MSVPPEDRFFLLGEGRRPSPIGVLGFRVEGESPDRERLAAAVEAAMARHPKAATRLVTERGLLGERLFWEHDPALAARALHVHERDEFPADHAAIEALYSKLVNEPLDASQGPTLEVHVFPSDADRSFLLLRYHHALGDGYGLLHFLRDLLAAYSGDSLPSPVAAATSDDASAPGQLRLLSNLIRFLRRRRREIGSDGADKLYDPSRTPGERGEVAFRLVGPERTAPLRRAARAHGARLNDVLVAAWSRGIEQWKRQRGLPCGTLRFMVNTGLRELGGEAASFDNHSSAFPLWVRPEDRVERKALLQCIAEQHQQCIDEHIPEAIQIFRVFLRLPLGLLRKMMDRRVERPAEAESLIVSNLGPLPVALEDDDPGMRLGRGRLVGSYVSIRAPMGPGALHACASTGGLLVLGLGYLTGLFERTEIEQLLDCVESELDAYAAGDH